MVVVMAASTDYGKRLLPQILDDLASAEPDRIIYSIAKSSDISQGFLHVSARAFANAVDKTAWLLHHQLGRSLTIQAVAYIGPRKLEKPEKQRTSEALHGLMVLQLIIFRRSPAHSVDLCLCQGRVYGAYILAPIREMRFSWLTMFSASPSTRRPCFSPPKTASKGLWRFSRQQIVKPGPSREAKPPLWWIHYCRNAACKSWSSPNLMSSSALKQSNRIPTTKRSTRPPEIHSVFSIRRDRLDCQSL